MPSALILGCANCVWEDAERALELFKPDAFIAVKDMMYKWQGRVDYGVTLHPERTAGYLAKRKSAGLNIDFQVWAHKDGTPTGNHRITGDWQGSSGLLAVKVARQEWFDRIVLAGVPMEKQYGHVARTEAWDAAHAYLNGWRKHHNEIKDIVRSMSGWTKAELGLPTVKWLSNPVCRAGSDRLKTVVG